MDLGSFLITYQYYDHIQTADISDQSRFIFILFYSTIQVVQSTNPIRSWHVFIIYSFKALLVVVLLFLDKARKEADNKYELLK